MEVKIKSNPPQTNPNNNIKVQSQTQNSQTPQQNLNNMSIEQLYQLLLQQLQQKQLQQEQSQNNEFIVKVNMKSSYIALKAEQMLLQRRKITLSALGYAVAQLLDSVMLVKKDLSSQGINNININLELFEREVFDVRKKSKKITGLRVTLTI